MHLSMAILTGLLAIQHLANAHTESVANGNHKSGHIGGTPSLAIKCDYRRHPKSGCEPNSGRQCDPKLKQCVCRAGHYQSMATGECLRLRRFNESCVASGQCRPAPHMACMAADGQYKQWRCQCSHGFWYDDERGRCVERLAHGQECQPDVDQCRTGLVCGDNKANATAVVVAETVCQCQPEYRYNTTAQECQHQSWRACPAGHQWSKHSRRCETAKHYSNRSGADHSSGGQPSNTGRPSVKNTKLMRPASYWIHTTGAGVAANTGGQQQQQQPGVGAGGGSSATAVAKDDDTDEKILEIILEVSFLIVCLLAYQACSKACCPDTDPDDGDTLDITGGSANGRKGSDEESMLSKGAAVSPNTYHTRTRTTAQAFKRHQRRVRKVFCKSRGGGGWGTSGSSQKLLVPSNPNSRNPSISSGSGGQSLSPSHYKNVIVRFDDSHSPTSQTATRAQCYNCRIYKEVYSPNARCKVCRASIIAQGLDVDQEYGMSADGKQLLPLPPYKGKPIRRSEEVGVPPHLKAPYLNNQPFWLK